MAGPRAVVVGAVRSGCRTSLADRCLHARSEATGDDEETGVSRRPVCRADRQSLGVPRASGGLGGFRFGPAALGTQGLHHSPHLGGRRHVAAQQPAGYEHPSHCVDALPRGEHVEDRPVDGFRTDVGDEICHLKVPRVWRRPEEVLDIASCHLGELATPFVGVQPAGRTNGTQQWDGESAGAHPRLQHPCPGEDICPHDDLGSFLGVDDGCFTRHGHGELAQRGAQGQELQPAHRRDDDPLRSPDEVIVTHGSLGGVEDPASLEDDGMTTPLVVGEGDPLPLTQHPAAPRGQGHGLFLGQVPELDEIAGAQTGQIMAMNTSWCRARGGCPVDDEGDGTSRGRGSSPGGRILDDEAVGGRHPQRGSSVQVGTGMGFGRLVVHVVSSDDSTEPVGIDVVEDGLDRPAQCAGGDGHRHPGLVQVGQQLRNAGHPRNVLFPVELRNDGDELGQHILRAHPVVDDPSHLLADLDDRPSGEIVGVLAPGRAVACQQGVLCLRPPRFGVDEGAIEIPQDGGEHVHGAAPESGRVGLSGALSRTTSTGAHDSTGTRGT